ncbi:MAG: DUF1350 family protein [Thermosynechococcaceae cyanobacterium MS004]|nr:DUF1350 family protein [Thermosynechococcaceae cyanobacterium MS004]
MKKNNYLEYEKISNSQALLHSNPKGVIQFIGSFVFGSFPAWAYKHLFQFLFDQGYSIILYRFPLNPFEFDHWKVSLQLLKEQQIVKSEIIRKLKEKSKSSSVIEVYSKGKYLWLGHSLGCKYIILLEVLSNNSSRRNKILKECLGELNAEKILKKIDSEKLLNQNFILDQPSIFLAPEISNTVRLLKSGWRISNNCTDPNQRQTECLIRSSSETFNLTSIVSFNWDEIAEDDVSFLSEQFQNKYFQPPLFKELQGWHFEPLSLHVEDLGQLIVDLFEELKTRLLSKPI